MKPLAESPWRQRSLFYLVGCAVALACGLVWFRWRDIFPHAAFDQQTGSLRSLKELVAYLPWMAAAVVLALRVVRGRRIRAGCYILGTATPIVVLMLSPVLGPAAVSLTHRRSFDAELWRNQESSQADPMWPPRLCMVDDLMSSGRLDGLTRDQVVQLLGPPDGNGAAAGITRPDMYYYLGPERGFIRIDSEWLFIAFDDDSTVNRHWLQKD